VSIEKKRQWVTAIRGAERKKLNNMNMNVAGPNSKGGIPSHKLRGTDKDEFFDFKGYAFDYDGKLVDQRKPAQRFIHHAEYTGTSAGQTMAHNLGVKGKLRKG